MKAAGVEEKAKLAEARHKTHAATQALERARRSESAASPLPAALIRFTANPRYEPTVKECLEIAQSLAPERIEILDSAWKSAEDCVGFEAGRRLVSLFARLTSEWYDKFTEEGDTTARKVFTVGEYSATESESVQGRADLRAVRSFSWRGHRLPMLRHLKIGKANDSRTTVRVYFEIVRSEKDGLDVSEAPKIVVGWCGRHLPIASMTS